MKNGDPGWQSLEQNCCLQKEFFSQKNKADEIPIELKYFQKRLKLLAKDIGVKIVMIHRGKKKEQMQKIIHKSRAKCYKKKKWLF